MAYPIKFGKYLLLERINVGGMAEVFKAKTFGVQGFERLLAIKRILPNMAEDDEFIKMFVDEARIVVQLSHSNVVQVYELGKYEEQYYIAMEFVLGKDLRQIFDRYRKKEKVFPVPAAAFVASKICDGLDYAHRKSSPGGVSLKLVHRDVSPQNILVSYEGAVKITDFGIAKAEDRSSKTQAGVLKGKFGYMSPEQIRGVEIDHRSDIFALGILLYEMVTGERLFIGESDFSTLEKVRAAEVPPPTRFNPDIPEELERIMLKALAREREERYQWASELHDDLESFLIVDNRIYNGKSLAAMLCEEYEEEIEQEQQKAEEFLDLSARSFQMEPESFGDKSVPGRAPVATPTIPAGPIDSEKTMIFEAFSDFASAETTIAPGLSELFSDVETVPGGTETEEEEASGAAVNEGDVSARGGTFPSHRPPEETTERNIGPLILGGTIVLCALILAAVWFGVPASNLGTVVITSTPVTEVEIFLDGQLIGKSTPIERKDIPLGEHLVVGKATGYAEKVYSFELAAEQPAYIEFSMEKIAKEAPVVVDDGTLQIVSSPPGASVRSNGVSRGETPLTLFKVSRERANLVELSKTGFVTQQREVKFRPGEVNKTIEISLVPVPGEERRQVKPTRPVKQADSDGHPLPPPGPPPPPAPRYGAGRKEAPVKARTGVDSARGAAGSVSSPSDHRKPKAVAPAPAPAPAPAKRRKPEAPLACSGSGARLSVMPVGIPNCRVTVGKKSLGVAPFFKKDAPIGKCRISIVCKDGRSHQVTRELKSGEDAKLIIKPRDW